MQRLLFTCLLLFTSVSLFAVKFKAPAGPLSKQEKVFEEAWLFVDSHYAFLKEKGINWDKTYSRFRLRVNEKTSDDSLFSILTQMLAPLNDGNVTLTTKDGKHFSANRPSRFEQEFNTPELRQKFWPMVDFSLVKYGFAPLKYFGQEDNSNALYAYSSNGSLGYLRIYSCKGGLNYINTIMDEFNGLGGIIVDIRSNSGGDDKVALNVAGNFTDKRVVAYTKQTRIEGMPAYTYPEEVYFKPKGSAPFLGKVVLLTNDRTTNAAEIFTLAMKQLPNVTIVGEASEGNFSDIYSTKLLNGWILTLSNQRCLSPQGVSYDGVGVPVDVPVKNSVSDLESNSDPVVTKAISLLNK